MEVRERVRAPPAVITLRTDVRVARPSPMREPVIATIGLGANLGDAASMVKAAIAALGALPQTQLVRASRLFSSVPIESSGPDYVNAVAQISTALSAPALLAELQTIELAAGRERPFRNAPRTLDLDVLLYGSAQINSPVLTVPHPRMYQRAFVLLPLAEVAPELVCTSALAAVQDQVLNVLATEWHADGPPLSP